MDIVGQTYHNILGLEFTVIEKTTDRKYGRILYRIRFTETQYMTLATKAEIKNKSVRDKMHRRTFGIGYIGNVPTQLTYQDYKKEYVLWRNMLKRCYDTNLAQNKDYMSYGGIGVTVCERWHCFANCLEDVPLISGYDRTLFQAGKITLDKDLLQQNIPHSQRVYSLDTCTFLSIADNCNLRDTVQYSTKFYATSPTGITEYVIGIAQFAKEHSMDARLIKTRLTGKMTKPYHGWTFSYQKCNDYPEKE